MSDIGSELPLRGTSLTPCILVSGEHADTREMMRILLEAWGYTVTTAGGPEESVGAAKSTRPDLVVLDASIPFPQTLETVEKLRECLDGAPIVLMSGFAHDVFRIAAIERGVAAYLTKPVDFDTLEQGITFLIRKRRETQIL